MLRTARILLLVPEDDLRRRLDGRLAEAGHDVATVCDDATAAEALFEGLDPDIVVAESDPGRPPGLLRDLAPLAAHLRIDRSLEQSDGFSSALGEEPARCTADPADVLRRVEEVLLDVAPRHDANDDAAEGDRCLDLARRLANALPRIVTAGDRIDLITDLFDTFFGVRGSLVVQRGSEAEDWVEASQGVEPDLAERISTEIRRREVSGRGIRPFLADLKGGPEILTVACLPVQLVDPEIDIALVLARAPRESRHRQALMNLVGSALRAAGQAEELERIRLLGAAQGAGLAGLTDMTREFARLTHPRLLAERVLLILRREASMRSAALFTMRDGDGGLLDPLATSGFSPAPLRRLGLSCAHGIGRACLATDGFLRLRDVVESGEHERELKLLEKVGLAWGARLGGEQRPLGVLLFGGQENLPRLSLWEQHFLRAVVASTSVALRGLEKLADFRNLSLLGLRGLVAALELHDPSQRGHASRVTRGAVILGRSLGLDEAALRELSVCAYLHDVGKLGAARDGEGAVALDDRRHPLVGSRILARGKPGQGVIQGVEQHHERWDGQGFPYGLRHEGIHLYGRILSIVDAYDRMTGDPDRPLEPEQALQRLELGAGLLWDPGLVAAFGTEVVRAPSRGEDATSDPWLSTILEPTDA